MNRGELEQLLTDYPLVKKIRNLATVDWFNPLITTLQKGLPFVGLTATVNCTNTLHITFNAGRCKLEDNQLFKMQKSRRQ
ncbi:hypothetical protein [Brenneria goodwinii]|uniref:hypothetical protein n=1 Tax=Brenneria goodwinii TaxID=1109412 RepID=UPI0036EFA805